MFDWQEKCSSRLTHSVDSDIEKVAQHKADMMIKSRDSICDNIYMFSEVTYADELDDIGKLNLSENRGQVSLFFEIITFDNKTRYRSAQSEEDIFKKYHNVKSMRTIKQQEYARLRQQCVLTNQDDLQ